MNGWTITKLAFSRILATKARSFLTTLGVIIGVASIVALTSIVNGATSGITSSLSSLGATTITVSGSSATALTEADAAAIRKLPQVHEVSTAVRGKGTGVNGSSTAQLAFIGVSSTYTTTNSPDVAVGSFLPTFAGSAGLRDVVLSAIAAHELAITAADLGKPVDLNGIPFDVVGVLNDANGFENSGTAYVSEGAARSLFAQAPYVSTITIDAASQDTVNAVQASADALLRARYSLSPDDTAQFSTTNEASLLSSLSSITGLLSLLLGGIASISLVVGGIGIMNIMLVSVRERTREIGVRRAIGAKRSQILAQFIIEAIVLSVVGGVLGLAIGLFVSAIIAGIAGWAFVISGATVALALGFSAGVGVVFGAWPARTASRLQPIDALRSE